MARLEIAAEAAEELEDAVLWYDSQCEGLGADLLAEVDAAIMQICAAPSRWRRYGRRDGVRRFLLHRFPYAVIYEQQGLDVRVVAIAHTRRRPGYWRDRLA